VRSQKKRCQIATRLLASSLNLVITALLLFTLKVYGQASLSDTTFAIGAGADGLVYAILVLPDGKILVGGDFDNIAGQNYPNLARLNSDGLLDTSFPAETDGSVYRLLDQPDGKILVGGSFGNLQGVARQGIGRLLTNGAVDPDFDAGPLPGSEDSAFSLAVQSDGKILYGNLAPNGELFRLTSNGQLDSSFAQTNSFHGWHIFAIHPRTNGSILVGGGFQTVNSFVTPGLALLNTNGLLDTNFTSQLKTNSNPTTILGQSDGSLLVGGGMWRQDSTNRMSLAKLTPNLAWDSNFHPDAFSPDLPASGYGYVHSMLPLPDGAILAGGSFEEVGGYWRRSIARLDSTGQVDPCFDPGLGLAVTPLAPFGAIALSRQSDGKILVGGAFVDLMSDKPYRQNVTRLLPQSDCDNNHVYLSINEDVATVAATFPPGGTNLFQYSTNLVDWMDGDRTTRPYVYVTSPFPILGEPQMFFRGKKEY
jgi:uncharacterized delta-60 repeat protein